MITFVTGKPGDGKSMYGMKLIAESLLKTERIIFTNIPVKEPELRAYLCKKGWEGDLNERLFLLKHEEVFEFYRFRSGRYVLPPSPDWVAARESEKGTRKVSRPEFLEAMNGQLLEMKKHPEALLPCEYHIDEAHDYFCAREWTDTGRGVLWYASKHRHLHDEVVFYTQVMANVEKQLRGLASETVRVRNQIRMSWGWFRKAPVFRVYSYYGAPEKTESATPFSNAVMHLDKAGLAATYNSAGALSIHASPEAIHNKAPLPHWALPVGLCAGIVCVGLMLAFAPLAFGKFMHRQFTSAAAGQMTGIPMPKEQKGAPDPVVSPGRAIGLTTSSQVERVYIEGLVVIGHEPTVMLTDGRKLQGAEVVEYGEHFVRTQFGEVFTWKPKRRAPVIDERNSLTQSAQVPKRDS